MIAKTQAGPPAVTVVIPTRNRPGQIRRAVGSVLANSYPAFELLVVDQSCDTSTREALAAYRADSRLRYVHAPGAGAAANRNLGLQQATTDLVAFTDDDCVANSDWLERIVACFAAHPEAQIVFGRVDPPAGYRPGEEFVPTYQPKRLEISHCTPAGMIFGFGANMSLRRAVLDRIGCFDETLGVGAPLRSAEEYDLALRAEAAGEVVLADPAVVVVHEGGIRRGLAERAHWYRDGYGTGALIAKTIKCRQWVGMAALLRIGAGGLARVLAALLTWTPPFHLSELVCRLSGTLMGFAAGAAWPVERGTQRFRRQP